VDKHQTFIVVANSVDTIDHNSDWRLGDDISNKYLGQFGNPIATRLLAKGNRGSLEIRGNVQTGPRGPDSVNQQEEKIHRIAVRGIQMHPRNSRAGLADNLCGQRRLSLGRLTRYQYHTGAVDSRNAL
jgi:hypothetical protein